MKYDVSCSADVLCSFPSRGVRNFVAGAFHLQGGLQGKSHPPRLDVHRPAGLGVPENCSRAEGSPHVNIEEDPAINCCSVRWFTKTPTGGTAQSHLESSYTFRISAPSSIFLVHCFIFSGDQNSFSGYILMPTQSQITKNVSKFLSRE